MMLREGGVCRHGDISPGKSHDQGVGENYTVVLEVLWLFRNLDQDNNAEGKRSEAVGYLICVLAECTKTCIQFI